MVQNVRGRADREAGGRAPQDAQPSLQEAAKEPLLDRAVDGVERRLERNVAGVGGDGQRPAAPREPQLHGDGGEKHHGHPDERKHELDRDVTTLQAEPARPAAGGVRDEAGGREWQQPDEQVGPDPRPAVWNTGQDKARSSCRDGWR